MTKDCPLRVARYIRVSRADQNPQMQADETARMIQMRQWELSETYLDRGVSGSKDRRPELDGSLELWPTLMNELEFSTEGLRRVQKRGLVVYGRDGKRKEGRVAEVLHAPSWWQRLSARAEAPVTQVRVAIEVTGSYDVADVVQVVRKAVDEDDDILTQFLDSEHIGKLLGQVETFDDLVDLIRAMQGEHETDGQFDGNASP